MKRKATPSRRFPVFASFDRGQIPTIACIDQTTTGVRHFEETVAAMQKFVEDHFAPVWGTPAKLVLAKKFVKGAWALVFLDDADVEGALGYHNLTPDHLPLSKVFVSTTERAGGEVSVTASHELAEMLVDPAINLCALGPNDWFYAYEVADAVEETSFDVSGVAMTNFVYPAFFEGFREPGSTQFDHLKKLRRPFQILKGGYMPVFKNGKWTQIFGSKEAKKRFLKEERWDRVETRKR